MARRAGTPAPDPPANELRASRSAFSRARYVSSLKVARGVLEGELPNPPVRPGSVHLDRPPGRSEDRDHRGDRVVVDRDAGHLRQHQSLPDRVGEASLAAPRFAGVDVQLAVAAVAERTVIADAEPAHALEEATQEVDAVVALRSPTPDLAPPHLLDPRPQLVRHRRGPASATLGRSDGAGRSSRCRATSAAADDTADRAQLHPRIVDGLTGAVYPPVVLRLRATGPNPHGPRGVDRWSISAGQLEASCARAACGEGAA